MVARLPRRFTLIDAMILVAAFAVGFAWVHNRWGAPLTARHHIMRARAGPPPGAPFAWARMLGRLGRQVPEASPVVASLAAALVVVRVRRPDHELCRLVHMPGMLGGLILLGTLGVLPCVLLVQDTLRAMGRSGVISYSTLLLLLSLVEWPNNPIWVGMIIPLIWAGLAPLQWWRSELGWIDPAGVVVGATWAGLLLIGWLAG